MDITGQTLCGCTRLLPIIGDPVEHVQAPRVLTREFARCGHNIAVVPLHVATDAFPALIDKLRTIRNVVGVIATAPHKVAAGVLCTTISDRADAIGAVSLLRRDGRKGWYGDLTEGEAFVCGLRASGFGFQTGSALIVGAGGAGCAIAHALSDAGAQSLGIFDIDRDRESRLIDTLNLRSKSLAKHAPPQPEGYELIVNATPLGVAVSDGSAICMDGLTSAKFVADLVTSRQGDTPLVTRAKRLGCKTLTGTDLFNSATDLMREFFLNDCAAAGPNSSSNEITNL